MRDDAGITDEVEHSDGSDQEAEEVFKQLRPNAKYKLMDILSGKISDPKHQKKRFRPKTNR